MNPRLLFLSALCGLAVSGTVEAGGRCGGWQGGGGFYGPAYGWGGGGWGGGPGWGWDGWGPSFGVSVVAPVPVYRAVYVSRPVSIRYGYSRSVIAQTQVQLARLGYYSSSIDGDFGPKTSRAIQRFQIDAGLPVTGALDRRTLSRLGVPS